MGESPVFSSPLVASSVLAASSVCVTAAWLSSAKAAKGSMLMSIVSSSTTDRNVFHEFLFISLGSFQKLHS